VEFTLFTDHNWYDLYLNSSFGMFYDGLFERLVDVMCVVYDVRCVIASGVLTLYELEASYSFVCGVYH
jgi:hypothetical protein